MQTNRAVCQGEAILAPCWTLGTDLSKALEVSCERKTSFCGRRERSEIKRRAGETLPDAGAGEAVQWASFASQQIPISVESISTRIMTKIIAADEKPTETPRAERI